MDTLCLILLLSILVAIRGQYCLLVSAPDRTTLDLQEVFLGCCLYYQNVRHPEAFINGRRNCSLVWETFRQAWIYRAPCDVDPSLYRAFAELTATPLTHRQAVLWEGSSMYELSSLYADYGRRYSIMADTFSGYLGDQLFWCGQAETPGINYHHCPHYGACRKHANYAFWQQTSKMFAEQLEGEVKILLNGSAPCAFSNTSILAEYELPHLNPDTVTMVWIYVLHHIDMDKRESCGEGSVKLAEDIIREYGHNVRCINDPVDMMYLLCMGNPRHPDCQLSATSPGVLSSTAVLSLALLLQLLVTSWIMEPQ